MRPLIYLGRGRNREVYRRGNYVIKVPLNEEGIYDNEHEFLNQCREQSRRAGGDEVPRNAMCRIHPGGILVMQYAMFVGPKSDETGYISYEDGPSWMGYVDGGQVGYNRFGQIVAYDYGYL